jgi:SAM-dependent methyltransferase
VSTAASPHDYAGQDLEALADLPNYYRWILRTFAPYLSHKSILEVGAGIGNFSAHYVDAVRAAMLLEPAPNLHHKLAQRFSDRPHIKTFCGTLETLLAEQPLKDLDAALMVNVLEHIEQDGDTLRALKGTLKGDGALLIFVPALQWLYGSLDALVHHCRRYDARSLSAVVQSAGFVIEQLFYFDALGVLPWWLSGRVLRQSAFSSRAAVIYDRVVVPIASRIESRVRVPLGKNLVCVARPAY